ncbi:junctional adhesion molecule C-like [Anneissia japonica]|uniref:junctional adhesion molecule C-like n=1 Tax=Anneissia japonica TaxID=1529436 RepID=UPI0014256E7A|nr:junctional adhesion molecule C-like [Anneissia japonica]
MSTLFVTSSLLFSVFSVCSAVIVTVSVDGHAFEGQGTRLVCTLKRNNSSNTNIPRITWEKIVNGSPTTIVQYQSSATYVNPTYNDRFSVVKNDPQHTLVIDNTNRTDDGTYKCDVALIDDVPSDASDDVTISVAYLSYPTLVTESMTLNEGDTATFTCVSGEGNPEPRVTWLKDDKILNVPFETSLVLNVVTKSDEGNYTCRAENDVLTGTNGKISRETATLTVISVDYCISSPCENEGNCIPSYSDFTCECKPGYSGRYCENDYSGAACSSSTGLTIGMFFVGIIVGAFGVIGGLISYTRIKQVCQIPKQISVV